MATAFITIPDNADCSFARLERVNHRRKEYRERGMRVKRRVSLRRVCGCWETVIILVNGYGHFKNRPCKHDAGKFLGIPIKENPTFDLVPR